MLLFGNKVIFFINGYLLLLLVIFLVIL